MTSGVVHVCALVAAVVLLCAGLLAGGSEAARTGSAGAHIKEHLNEYYEEDVTDLEGNENLYLFSMHDRNGDGKLDGLEIRALLSDDHAKTINELSKLDAEVDRVLAKFDKDNDGRLSSAEFFQSDLV